MGEYMSLNEEKNNKEKICEKCLHIQRPFRKELNDTVYCTKTLKFIELNASCPFWVKYRNE
jgi:hypothetical protein